MYNVNIRGYIMYIYNNMQCKYIVINNANIQKYII